MRLEVSEIEFQPKPLSLASSKEEPVYAIKFEIRADGEKTPEDLLTLEYTTLVVKIPRTVGLDEAVKQARARIATVADQLARAARL